MIFLEKKGIIQMMLLLLNNQEFSKYEIEKRLQLSNHTINSCLTLLEEKEIINISKNNGPRNKFIIDLTELGVLIARKLKEIEFIFLIKTCLLGSINKFYLYRFYMDI